MLSFVKNLPTIPEAAAWWDFCLGNTVSYSLFAQWLGDIRAPSRVAVKNHLLKAGYKSILDVACGLCIDYYVFNNANPNINYHGIDISQKLVARARAAGINVIHADIDNIPYDDNMFDIVYGRHILEHLDHYKRAMGELIRLAKKEVLIVFFIKPSNAKDDIIDQGFLDGHTIYHNTYSQSNFVDYILSYEKVNHIIWEQVNDKEIIAHIMLK